MILKELVVLCSSNAEAYQSCDLNQSQAELQTHKNNYYYSNNNNNNIIIIIYYIKELVVLCSSSAEACQSCDLSQSQAELQTHKNTVGVVSAIFTAATQLLRQAQACTGLSSITNHVILKVHIHSETIIVIGPCLARLL